MNKYLQGHVGELILFFGFALSVVAFVLVFLITKTESTLLGTLAASMGGGLTAYMQRRAQSTSTTNIDSSTIEQIDTAPATPPKTDA